MITIFLKGLNKRKIGVKMKADFKVLKAFFMVLSYFHFLNDKLVEFVSGLAILEKSFINR